MLPTRLASGLPRTRCLVAAIATPLTRDYRPDHGRLAALAQALLAAGCDGIALFGTTGEGAEFTVEDRTATLDAVLAAGFPARRLIVSAGALAIPDAARLAAHATDAGRRRRPAHAARRLPRGHHRGRDLPLLRHRDRAHRPPRTSASISTTSPASPACRSPRR